MLAPLHRFLVGVDWALHRSAAAFGAASRNHYLRRSLFLGTTALLFVAAWLLPAGTALALLAVGVWCLAAVYWVWICNEHVRSRVAKKIDTTDPDSLPRLRDVALMTALVTPLVLLVLFDKCQHCFAPFAVQGEPALADWFWFVLDKTYLRALPDTLDLGIARLEGIHAGRIDYHAGGAGFGGRALVLFAWALLYAILLQGLLRWWQVRRDIDDAISGVALDPDMAVRLGRRACRPLLTAWQEPDLPAATRANMATALGRIGHERAIPALEAAAQDHAAPAEVRAAALVALGQIGGPAAARVLAAVLLDDDDVAAARAAAAEALGLLKDPAATPPLLEKLRRVQAADRRKMDAPDVRKAVAAALGEHLTRRRAAGDDASADVERAVGLILSGEGQRSLLQDAYLRVRNRAATAVGRLGDPRAVAPLTDLVKDNENPKLLQAGAEALGRLLGSVPAAVRDGPEGQAAVAELRRRLEDSENDSVQEAAVRGLGLARATSVADLLWDVLDRSLRADVEGMSQAATDALLAIDPEAVPRVARLVHQAGREQSQRRRLTVLNDAAPAEERLQAARELGEYRDRRGRQALKRTADNEAATPELREACRAALDQIRNGRR